MNRELLKEIRKRKNITQEQMANALGYKAKSAYCSIETGVRGLNVSKAKDISDILCMSDDEKIKVFLS